MKKITLTLTSFILGLSVTSGAFAASNSGPNANCQLQDGSMDYIPVLVCQSNGGQSS